MFYFPNTFGLFLRYTRFYKFESALSGYGYIFVGADLYKVNKNKG